MPLSFSTISSKSATLFQTNTTAGFLDEILTSTTRAFYANKGIRAHSSSGRRLECCYFLARPSETTLCNNTARLLIVNSRRLMSTKP